jgi:NAD(P)-dependent dehydrogenase (short-subunit alcohol dehydrogenase family)
MNAASLLLPEAATANVLCSRRRCFRPGPLLAQGSAATKAAIIQFTRVIAHQYARSAIRATLILRGMMTRR